MQWNERNLERSEKMSETQYTPGKWEYRQRYRASYTIAAETEDGMKEIAWLGEMSSHSVGENKANARLISKAPELLQALEELFGYVLGCRRVDTCLSEREVSEYKRLIAEAKRGAT